jgi:hypothetical protein
MKALVFAAALFAGSHAFAETLTVHFMDCPGTMGICAIVQGHNDGQPMGVVADDQTVAAEILRQAKYGIEVNVDGKVTTVSSSWRTYYQLNVYSFSTPSYDSRPRGFQAR